LPLIFSIFLVVAHLSGKAAATWDIRVGPTPATSRSQNQLRMKCAMLAEKAPAPPSI
jgi:hypothetical protein